jgi:hypothetical protein
LAGSEKLFISDGARAGHAGVRDAVLLEDVEMWLKYNAGLSEFWTCDWRAWPSEDAQYEPQ